MSLSSPVPRSLIHERAITCRGYLRDDGLWDVEGTFSDTKTATYHDGDHGAIPAGVPLHGMRLRITIDATAKIHEAEAEIGHAPFSICPIVAPLASRLVGLSIGKGFMAEARRIMGGTKGCTHVLELLGEVAGTAFQTLHDVRKKETNATDHPERRPLIIDTCHALRADGPVVRQLWPTFAQPGNAKTNT
ncbi:MAG: DUF2889 domain-containing protein [Rhodospirillaceae bacterium]|nr:DUF2889 domain-containing protein [Rhodospirillaceae bacterium]